MNFAIFGLTVSSAWGNGHATTWRGLLKALHRAGHQITFFEQDVPYYSLARDLPQPDFCRLVLYSTWDGVLSRARQALDSADVAIVTSYCPDGLAACELMLGHRGPLHVFYDIDTPVTLASLAEHGIASSTGARYLSPDLIPQFDLYLSFTGGPMLAELQSRWGARSAAPLYCSVDPDVHFPVKPREDLRCALGYLGTYSADRQPKLDELLARPAEQRPGERFIVAGTMYPPDTQWPPNVRRLEHLSPADHAAFYSSSRLSLNITRAAMVRWGYSPSVRLFEAASCGTPLLTDWWPGLDEFFEPGEEMLVANGWQEACGALDVSDAELERVATRARERTLAEHTCEVRAAELLRQCEAASAGHILETAS